MLSLLLWHGRPLLAQLRVAYIRDSETFREIDDFVAQTAATYGFRVDTMEGCSLKQGLFALVEGRGVKAFFAGVRRTDKGGASWRVFAPCGAGWPPATRIAPILDWSYDELWTFVGLARVAVCPLYQCGYTSIGLKSDTVPNPGLRRADGKFLPAKCLANPELERTNRTAEL